MSDSPHSTKPNQFAVEADGARMPSPPTFMMYVLLRDIMLPEDVAMQVAELARVPAKEFQQFWDGISKSVRQVWEMDRRAVSSGPGPALFKAAEAARTFNEAICSLNKDDHEWVESLRTRRPYEEFPHEFVRLASALDDLFSIAIGKVNRTMVGTAMLRQKKGRAKGTVNDAMFELFIRNILHCTANAGGELTFDKNFEKGTLKDVLNILRPHLPRGVVPNALPYGTIQKIKTELLKDRRLFPGLLTLENI